MSSALSNVVNDHGPADPDRDVDRRRALISLGAALGVHLVLLTVFWLGVGRMSTVPVVPAVTIQLQDSSGAGALTSAAGGGQGPGGPSPGAGAAPPAAGAAPLGGPGSSSSFVIPTPRAQPADSSPSSSGPSFREAGGRTGVAQSVSAAPSAQPGPEVAPVQQGRGSGSGAASGSGASSVQRSGTGELVGGSSNSGGSLDLSKLDQALGGGGAGHGGSGGSSGSGSSGTGSGAGGAGGGGGAGSGTGAGYPVQWGSAGGEGRRMVFSVSPRLPAWVSRQGLTLSVTVKFSVLPNGVVQGASVAQSSGYADVDAAVVDAIRMCLFNAVENAPTVNGVIPYRTDWK